MVDEHKLSYMYLSSYFILLFSSVFEVTDVLPGIFSYYVFKIGSIIGILINILLFICFNRTKQNKCYANVFFICLIIFMFGMATHVNIIPPQLIVLFSILLNVNVLTNMTNLLNIDLFVRIMIMVSVSLMDLFQLGGNYFGFGNPNMVGTMILGIVCSMLLRYRLYYDNRQYKYIYYIIISLMSIVFFYGFTKCRALLISGIFIIIFACLKNFSFMRKLIERCSKWIGLLIVISAMIVVYKFDPLNNLWEYINYILSDRLAMQSTLIQAQPLKLYGQHISHYILSIFNNNYVSKASIVSGINTYTIDNSYLSIAYHFGIIGLILVVFILLWFLNLASRNNEYIPCILLLSLFIYSCVASDMLSSYNIISIIYIAASYFHDHKEYKFNKNP